MAADAVGSIPLAATVAVQRRVMAVEQAMVEQMLAALPASGDSAEISSESLALLSSQGGG